MFVYSLESKKSSQITDGMSDALFPRFDKNGKYLYFTASTDTGLTTAGLDMSSDERRVSRSVYVAVLSKDEKSPLAPESDEEEGCAGCRQVRKVRQGAATTKDTDKDKEKESEKPVVVKIDLDGIGQRILSLPIPPRNYLAMLSGKSGVLFLAEGPAVITEDDFPNLKQTLHKFDLSKRKTDKFLDEVNAVADFLRRQQAALSQGRSVDDGGHRGAAVGRSQARLRAAEAGRDGSAGRTSRDVATDVRRDVAHRARLLLRPRLSRARSRQGEEEVRAVSRSDRLSRGAHVPVRGVPRRADRRPYVRWRR